MASVAKREWTYKGEKKEAWVVRYTDQGGKRRLQTFDKKRDADRYRMKVEFEIEQGTHIAAREALTVKELMERFLEYTDVRHRDGKIADSYRKKMHTYSRRHIVPALGNKPATELTFRDLEAWATSIREKSPAYGGWGPVITKRISPGAARAIMFTFKLALDFGVKRDYVARNLMPQVLQEHGKNTAPPIRTFSKAEVMHLLRVAEVRRETQTPRLHLRQRILLHLAVFCGMRIGEIGGLTLPALNLPGRAIAIRHTLHQDGKLGPPKSRAGNRVVPVPAHVVAMIEEWLARFWKANPGDRLFPEMNRSWQVNFHQKAWRPLLEAAGLSPKDGQKRFHFHALRHFAASSYVDCGMPMTDVAELMGHSHFDMTLRTYAHPLRTHDEKALMVQSNVQALIPPPSANA